MSTNRSDVIDRLRGANPVDASDLEQWVKDEEAQQIMTRIIASPPGPKHREATIPRPARLALLGGMSIIAAVALVLGLLPGDVDDPEPATAAEALVRAAGAAAEQPADPVPAAGEFAYSRSSSAYQSGFGYEEDAEPWAVLDEGSREMWVATDGSGRILAKDGDRTFFGPRDEARCRDQLGDDGCERVLKTNEDFEERFDKDLDVASFGDRGLSYSELRKLPTDPDELEPLMRKIAAGWANPDFEMFVMVGDVLRQPLTPRDVRVALYEVAARIEGVELIGEIDDPVGREGTAVALTSAGHVTPLPKPGEGDIRHEIIFDPDTGRFLAERDVLVNRVDYLDADPGTVVGWTAYLESGIVDSVEERPE